MQEIHRVTGEFHKQRPVARGFNVFFDLRLTKQLGKQSWGWWFEITSCPLWRHCNDYDVTLTSHEHRSISTHRQLKFFVPQFIQANNKAPIKALYYWHFVVTGDWPVMKKVCPGQDIFMTHVLQIRVKTQWSSLNRFYLPVHITVSTTQSITVLNM